MAKTRKHTRRSMKKRGGGYGSGGWQFQPATPGTRPVPAPPAPAPPAPATKTRRNHRK